MRTYKVLNCLSPYVRSLVVAKSIIYIVILCFFSLPACYAVSTSALTQIICVLSLIDLTLSLFTWYGTTGSIFNLYGLFLASAYLFNAGQLFLEIFDLNENGLLGGSFSGETTLQAACLATICLASMNFGALVAVAITRKERETQPSATQHTEDLSVIRAVGWGLFSISAVPMVVMMGRILPEALKHGYASLYEAKADVGIDALPMLIAGFLFPGAIYMLASSRDSKITARLAMVSIVAYAFVRLAMGWRAHAIIPLLGSIWIYDKCVQHLSRPILTTLGLLLFFVVFPLVRISRDIGGEERYSIAFYVESYFSIDNPVTAIVGEMGSSLSTVAHTIELVPRKRPHDMGVGYLYSLLTIFPNIFGGLHPSVARGLPSSWLTWEISPDLAARGGGLGYSFIAEAYLEFGWVGAPLVVFGFGLGLALLQLWGERFGGAKEAAFVACVMSEVLLFPRAELCLVVRPLVWEALFPYLLTKAIPKLVGPRFVGQSPAAGLDGSASRCVPQRSKADACGDGWFSTALGAGQDGADPLGQAPLIVPAVQELVRGHGKPGEGRE